MQILDLTEDDVQKNEDGLQKETLDPKLIMERFDQLIEKNQVEKGGSFYIQSKVYWAKEQLMIDQPKEFNLSKWNPEGAGKKAMDKEEEFADDEEKTKEKK